MRDACVALPFDLLALAEEHYLASFGVVLGVGLVQGAILSRGMRNRFESLRRHARAASIILLVIFSMHTAFGVANFAFPDKITLANSALPSSLEDLTSLVLSTSGVDGGFWSVIAVSISVFLVLFFKFGRLPGIARYFMLVLSMMTLLLALATRFTEYTPSAFHIILYAFYNVGITVGMFVVMRRKTELE